MAALGECLVYRHESNLSHDQSVLEIHRPFEPMLCLLINVYCLLSNCVQYIHVEVFNRDGNLFCVGAIQLLFKLYVTQPSDAVNTAIAKQTEGHRLALLS